jgi:Zn ribbon nucleic-acid-binding protein
MSRDLTPEEREKFIDFYGAGAACESCGNTDVVVKIWEKYGTDAFKVGGDIGPTGIVGAIVACDPCGHAQTVARAQILKAG